MATLYRNYRVRMGFRIVDDLAQREYSLEIMTFSPSIRLTLSAALLSTPFFGVAEDLDAALEAQKKKASRRVYSERAHLTPLHIAVPKTMSEEEKNLDRDLRRLENELDRQAPPMRGGMMVPRASAPSARKPKNWLTPELLDAENDASLTDENDSSWIVQELERQDAIRLQNAAVEKETAQLEKQLREDARQADPYPSVSSPSLSPIHLNPASQYTVRSDFSLQNEARTTQEKKSSFLSPARRDSGVIESSFSSRKPFSSQPTSVHSEFNRPAQKVNNTFSPKWTNKKKKPLSPLKRVRQSSPIHRKDPFADDFMPEFKTSIWD